MRSFNILSTSLLLLAASSLCGCPSKPYSAPMSLPAQWSPLDTTQFIALSATINDGAKAPLPIKQLKARCLDQAVCSAEVSTTVTPHVIEIRPVKAGKTSVEVEYHHPRQDKTLTATMGVTFVEPKLGKLALDAPLPAKDVAALLAGFPGEQAEHPVRCMEARYDPGHISGPPEHKVTAYHCKRPVTREDARALYATCSGICPDYGPELIVCAEVKEGKAAAMTFYSQANGASLGAARKVGTAGTPTAGVCALK